MRSPRCAHVGGVTKPVSDRLPPAHDRSIPPNIHPTLGFRTRPPASPSVSLETRRPCSEAESETGRDATRRPRTGQIGLLIRRFRVQVPGGAQAALFSRRGSTLNRERCLVRCRPTSRHRCHPQERLPPGRAEHSGTAVPVARCCGSKLARSQFRSGGFMQRARPDLSPFREADRCSTGLLSLHLPLTVCSHLDP